MQITASSPVRSRSIEDLEQPTTTPTLDAAAVDAVQSSERDAKTLNIADIEAALTPSLERPVTVRG